MHVLLRPVYGVAAHPCVQFCPVATRGIVSKTILELREETFKNA